jgi:hypothetical protein
MTCGRICVGQEKSISALSSPRASRLSLAKMLAGANTFEISDTQEDESEAALARRSDVTMLHWAENGWMEFSRSTGANSLWHT